MKKNWFYLFALICSVALFTACSDDEDTSWQQIPQTEITVGENATLTVNGETATTGSVQMTVNDATSGVLTLNNVVPGYNEVQVNVVLEKQADNTFNFSGSADINTAPATKTLRDEPAILTVEVEGTISLEGQVSVAVTTSGLGLYAGTYTADQLALTYGGVVMDGKSVTFDIIDAQTATITLEGADNELLSALVGSSVKNPGVVPGEASTVLNVTLTSEGTTGYSFEGTDESNGRTLNYTGSIEAGKLTLDVNATFSNDLIGTWNLVPVPTDASETVYPIHSIWQSSKGIEIFPGFEMPMETILSLALRMPVVDGQSACQMLTTVLQSVTFGADGNLVASYSDAANVASPSWQDSPVGLVQYCVKDGQLLAYLDINTIITALTSPSTRATTDDLLAELLPLLLAHMGEIAPMLSEGIPLAYSADASTGVLTVYIDQTGLGGVVLGILNEVVNNAELMAMIAELASSSMGSDNSLASMLPAILEQLPEVVAGTTTLELGLNFNPATAE